jgi:Tfp pilus assembly protein PilF
MRGGVVLAVLAWAAVAFAAEPYLPTDDAEVLEILPRSLLAGRDELTALRRRLAAVPSDADLATDVAARYLQLGNQEGDPRFYGYARAAIGPWWDAADVPPEILQLRAKLKEKEHRYDDAVADLERLLAKRPRDVQAWVEVANIRLVQGRYTEARQACDALSEFADPTQAMICRAPLQVMTGQAQQAYDAITSLVGVARRRLPGAVQWMITMQANITTALGDDERAERHFREGLANQPADMYLLRTYADFLLDQGREREVLELLGEHTSDNGVLLAAAIAARRCGEDQLAHEWQAQLESRFEEIRLRGTEPHGRFEARCALELQDDPQRALSLALANWQRQKEIPDTRNVLEAALAARDYAAAQPVVEFLAEQGTQHVVLRRLADRLERRE